MGSLEDDIRSAKDNKKGGGFVEKIKGIGELFGEDAIDQTSKITESQLTGLVVEEGISTFLEEYYGIIDKVSEIVCKRKVEQSPSIKGAGREDYVKILSSADLEEKDEKSKFYKVP